MLTVVGLFKNEQQANEASEQLVAEGFDSNDIDISSYRNDGSHDDLNTNYKEDEDTGGFWDWLFGDDDDTRTKYSEVGSRHMIVSYSANDREEANRAVSILDNAGAIDVEEEHRNTGRNLTPGQKIESTAQNLDGDGETVIPVVKEEIAIGKREVETGGVRVRSTIVEKPVEESVRLRHERVYVSRNPVDRTIDADEAEDAFQEKSIEFTEHNEEAVVEKSAKVVEEVTVGKETEEREEIISDTVRETEIEVDESKQNVTDTKEEGFKVKNFNDNSNNDMNRDARKGFSDSRIDRVFDNVEQADDYYDFLIEQGYSTDEITVMMSKETKEKFYDINDHVEETGDSALEGAGAGSAIGGTVGALAGAIAAVGSSIIVPGLGLAIAGPVAASLAGAGAGGATGAVVGALTKAGVSDSLAAEYDEAMKRGEIIISVDPSNGDHNGRLDSYQDGRETYNNSQMV